MGSERYGGARRTTQRETVEQLCSAVSDTMKPAIPGEVSNSERRVREHGDALVHNTFVRFDDDGKIRVWIRSRIC